MFKHMITLAAVAGLVLALAGAATHGAVITPNGVGASMCWEWGYQAHLIDGSGLNQTGDVTAWTHAVNPGSDQYQWLSNPNYEATSNTRLWFYFSEPTNIYKAYLWQYSSGSRGLNGFRIWGSTTASSGNSGQPAEGDGSFTDLSGPLSMTSCPSGALAVTQTFDLLNPGIGLRTVRISIASSHGSSYVGLGEVRFDNAPEPATLALLGLGGLGLILGRKRR